MRRVFPLLVFVLLAPAGRAEIKSDEEVVFFPTAAWRDGATWVVPIHGWIYEPERDSGWRREVIEEVQEHLEVAPDSPDGRRCAERARRFLVDNERGKEISIRIGGRVHTLPESGANGHFEGTVRLPANRIERHARRGVLEFQAITTARDGRRFAGRVLLPPREGVSVISDIDDTIKVSEVLDRDALLRHTFARPFEAVPGMAPAYAAWAREGASFHFVSSSPWQLYPPLEAFRADAGFPAAAFHLKSVRLKDRTLLNLFKDSLETKPPVIRAILQRWPHHRFLLVGDSGEQDPEVYGLIAREYPQRIVHVFIRRVAGAANGEKRFAKAFRGLPPDRWTVFSDATALKPAFTERER
ncbi:MAG: App1 family protein [Deltaproteobacteria bacterium]|nr:MAG: App1 family protein [Deltaproteobacteria bacterium]